MRVCRRGIFTPDEAKAFAKFARTRLHIRVKIKPAKLPISNDSKSFETLLAERGYLDMLVLHDDAGNELDFAVACYDEDAQEGVTEHMRAGGKLS